MTINVFHPLMWSIPGDSKPDGCTCELLERDNASGQYLLIIDTGCPIHSKYLATWKPGMCNVINWSTREEIPPDN